jgi:AcrR family transcriptional regulator
VPFDLPLAEPDPQLTERADAARNRRRILAAAAALVDERGIEAVSMQDVARAACVGTGTLYRRFGDRAGLALALLDEHTRAFQDALIAGPPPLGPGAAAAERLHAFGAGYLELLERHAEILLAASPMGREGGAPQELMVTHLIILLRAAAPHVDAEFAARSLLASVSPGQYLHLRRRLGWSVERVRDGWGELVDGLLCRSSGSG